MSKGVAFFGLSFCLLIMNSCAGFGALATITAFGVEGYEEARVHRPDLKLEPLSSYVNFSSDQPSDRQIKKTHTAKVSPDFGFNCSKLSDKKNNLNVLMISQKLWPMKKAKPLRKKGKQLHSKK